MVRWQGPPRECPPLQHTVSAVAFGQHLARRLPWTPYYKRRARNRMTAARTGLQPADVRWVGQRALCGGGDEEERKEERELHRKRSLLVCEIGGLTNLTQFLTAVLAVAEEPRSTTCTCTARLIQTDYISIYE